MTVYRYSTLDQAQRCLRKYKYLYVDGLKYADLGIPESGDMRFGTAVHASLQALLEGEDGTHVFYTFWDSDKETNLKFGQWDWEAYRIMGPVFLERFNRLHAKNYEPIHMEKTLDIRYSGIKFEGTPDFVGKVDGQYALVDFKTSRSAYTNDKLICNPQMYLYAYMAEQTYGILIENLIYTVFVKHPAPRIQTIKIKLDYASLKEHIENLVDHAGDLETRRVYPKNTSSCLMGAYRCEFFTKCFPNAEDN